MSKALSLDLSGHVCLAAIAGGLSLCRQAQAQRFGVSPRPSATPLWRALEWHTGPDARPKALQAATGARGRARLLILLWNADQDQEVC